jgi:hypothetical protein
MKKKTGSTPTNFCITSTISPVGLYFITWLIADDTIAYLEPYLKNVCNSISTNLQYGERNGKTTFHPDNYNAMSISRNVKIV